MQFSTIIPIIAAIFATTSYAADCYADGGGKCLDYANALMLRQVRFIYFSPDVKAKY